MTPSATLYVIVAVFPVFPEYVMLPFSVGAANWFSKVSVADGALMTSLVTATTTMLNVAFAFVNGTVMVAVVPIME